MIEQKSFIPFPDELLPKGFKYPEHYRALSCSTETIIPDKQYGFPWCFDDYGTTGAELSYEYRNQGKPDGFNLIPFANNGDWFAYFDGNDCSGNPKVFVFDETDLPFHICCKDFDEWLKDAINIAWYPS